MAVSCGVFVRTKFVRSKVLRHHSAKPLRHQIIARDHRNTRELHRFSSSKKHSKSYQGYTSDLNMIWLAIMSRKIPPFHCFYSGKAAKQGFLLRSARLIVFQTEIKLSGTLGHFERNAAEPVLQADTRARGRRKWSSPHGGETPVRARG